MIARPPRRTRRRRRHLLRALVLVVGAALVFVVGLALGQALRDRPQPAERTELRTLRAGTVAPPPRTVTVTVTDDG